MLTRLLDLHLQVSCLLMHLINFVHLYTLHRITVVVFVCLISGVDDILPILSYIIIRSGLPQLVSETALMEDFIQDG